MGATPSEPSSGPPNGDLYGTTVGGGVNGDYGTVFKVTLVGTFTTLYSFCAQANCADGQAPYAGLIQATNGDLYGTTSAGGANGKGTVFQITPNGDLKTLDSFCSEANCTDGATPYGGIVQVTDGNLFRTTSAGGRYPVRGVLMQANSGTVFKLSLAGKLTTFYSFCAIRLQSPWPSAPWFLRAAFDPLPAIVLRPLDSW